MFFGEYDYDTDIRVQRKEAFDDGISIGIKTIAFNLLNSGFNIIDISKNTGLSIEEIQNLKTDNVLKQKN